MTKNVNAIYEDGAFRPIDGDLSLEASGRMRPDGRIEGSAALDGRIADAIALARGRRSS